MSSDQDRQLERQTFADGADRSRPGAGSLAEQFAELTATLLAAPSVEDVLRRVLDATTLMVPAADLASFTLMDDDGGFHTPAETDLVATDLDLLQYRFREGPCVEPPSRAVRRWHSAPT